MRTMFAQSVADYRGMDFAAVIATEAQVYQGHEAIAIGFADRVGTFADLMRELADGAEDVGDDAAGLQQVESLKPGDKLTISIGGLPSASAEWDKAVAEIASALSAEDLAKMARAEVADAISASGLAPALAMALLAPAANVTPDTAAARIAHAKALADICAAAGLPDVAADYATKNTDLETARAQLIAVKAEDGPEIVTAHPAKSAGSPLRAAAIYEERRKATE